MGRARITLKPISNERCRKSTLKQRKEGLIRKVDQFCTMCRVEACLIMFDDNNDDVGPMTWPEDSTLVRSIIENYESQKTEKPSKTFVIQDFFDNRKNMIESEISKLQKQAREIKYPTWDPSLKNMGEEPLRAFIANVNAKIEACDQRINMLKNMNQDKANTNSMQNMASSSHISSQLNLIQNNTSQTQFIPTHVEPLLNGRLNLTNSTNHVGGASTSYGINNMLRNMQQDYACFSYMPSIAAQSQLNCLHNNSQSQLTTLETLKSLEETNNTVVDFANQVDVPLDSTNQLGEPLNWANHFSDFELANGPIGFEDWSDPLNGDLVGWTSQPGESIMQNIPIQSQNEQQEVALSALPPQLDGFQTDYHDMLFQIANSM